MCIRCRTMLKCSICLLVECQYRHSGLHFYRTLIELVPMVLLSGLSNHNGIVYNFMNENES